MSDDDMLKLAARSLRDANPIPESQVNAVRARLMSSVQTKQRRSARVYYFLLPAAAVLVASSALAGGGRWQKLVERLSWHRGIEKPREVLTTPKVASPRPPVLEAPVAEPPVPRQGLPGVVAEPAPALEAAPSVAPVVEAPRIEALPVPAAAPVRKSARPSSPDKARDTEPAEPTSNTAPNDVAPSAPTPSVAPPDAAEAKALAVYRKAHQLHFQAKNHAAALEQWDEYLRLAPRGPLVVEARYNRALALVRLGRVNEAREALTHFAKGEMAGGYRKQEARALLEALDTSP